MPNPNEILLLTSTILIGQTPIVAITDPSIRLTQYLCSLFLWITRCPLDVIVYCDNSRSGLKFSKLISLAAKYHKTLEILSFDGNEEAQTYGKGYGEGKIIEYSLNHSQWMRNDCIFYKSTGRLYVENFSEIRAAHKQDENVYGDFDTRFFKTGSSFFRNNLMTKYREVNDLKGVYLEHVYDRYLIPMKDIFVKRFSINPKIIGRSATVPGLVYHSDYDEETILQSNNLLESLGDG